jgi:hypothetical protein
LREENKQYYHEMLRRDRAHLIIRDGHLVAVVTYLIGDDDDKYLHNRVPWEIIEDDPDRRTVYIDQLLVKDHDSYSYIHREFKNVLIKIKQQFPQVKRAKWIRIGAMFRKHGIKEGAKSYVHCKDIK